jgi:hypothetical protein
LFHQENIFSTFRSLAETITASSFATEETFPFVTVPGFEVAGRHARIQSGIEILAYTPLISKENTSLWQQYAFSRQGWIDESRSYVEATVGALSGGNFINTTITPIRRPKCSSCFFHVGRKIRSLLAIESSSVLPCGHQLQHVRLALLQANVSTCEDCQGCV